jgi:4-diphosphocytidyl-2-C-methyl-D-erythritol kinase
MVSFPNAKINLGLKILRKRSDGFHDIETLMIPIALCDVLEILESKSGKTTFKCTGLAIDAKPVTSTPEVSESAHTEPAMNLVFRMYELLKRDFGLPPVFIHLHKAIPAGAGLGGGSSDCAHTLKMLDNLFGMVLSAGQQTDYVSQLGSDCAFFIDNKPAIASGRGEILHPVDVDLKGLYIYIVKPDIHINTGQAYSWVKPSESATALNETVAAPVSDWKSNLFNDFEIPVFKQYPELRGIKEELYHSGAMYAAMSGSGSAIFGIFQHEPETIPFPGDWFQWIGLL